MKTQLLTCLKGVPASISALKKTKKVSLKTTLGNHIKRLLGLDDDLVKYDDLRFKLKAATKLGMGCI